MAKYTFKNIQNGQITDGYTVIQIENGAADIANDDAAAILLAEKHGGELAAKPAPKTPKKETD